MKMTSMARTGAHGNLKLLGKYGGRNKEKRYAYANGGAVPGGAPRKAYADGGPIDGMPARSRMDRKGPKGKKKEGKTTVNVVVAGKGGPDAAGTPPPMPMPPPGAGPGGPPPGPPMPPPGMPMRARGGRLANLGKYAHGGRVKKADGGWAGEGDSGKAKKEESAANSAKADTSSSLAKIHGAMVPLNLGAAAVPAGKASRALNLGVGAFNAGAAALNAREAASKRKEATEASKEGDEAEGHKRGGAVKKYAKGGRIHMTAGACSGEGRLEKSEEVEKHHGRYADGGSVKKKADGGVADVEARQSATDRAARLRSEANDDVAKGAAGSMVGTTIGALATGRRKGPGVLGIAGPALGLGYLAKKGMDNAVKRKEANEADKTAAGEERKRGGKVGCK